MELTRAACAQRRQNKSDAQHMHWAMRSCKGRDCLQKSVFGTWYDHWGSAQRIRRKRHVQREGENPNRSKIVASLSWAPPSQRKLGWIQYVEMDLCDFCMKARLFFHLFRTKLIIYIYIPKAGVLSGHLLHFNVFLLGLAHMPVDLLVQVKHLSCRPSNLSAVDHHQVSHAFWIPLHLLMHFQFRNSSRRRQRDWKKCTSSSGQGGTAQTCLRAFRICGFVYEMLGRWQKRTAKLSRKDFLEKIPIGCDLNILNIPKLLLTASVHVKLL